MKNFIEFWTFIKEEAESTDSWWLDGWLDECLETYVNTPICDECGCKVRDRKSIYDKTGNYLLEQRTVCLGCGQIFSINDNRGQLRKMIESGDILQKYIGRLSLQLSGGKI